MFGPPLHLGRSRSAGRWAGALVLLGSVGCSIGEERRRLHTEKPPPAPSGTVSIEPRTALLPTFPCSRCHARRAPNPRQRPLTEFHTQKVLAHGSGGWCYRCHSENAIDELHLADGTLVGFDEAYVLCGSCHGSQLQDWRNGIHGLTTGYWLGARSRRSCPACHDPHQPAFPPMVPERPPALPRNQSLGARSAENAAAENGGVP